MTQWSNAVWQNLNQCFHCNSGLGWYCCVCLDCLVGPASCLEYLLQDLMELKQMHKQYVYAASSSQQAGQGWACRGPFAVTAGDIPAQASLLVPGAWVYTTQSCIRCCSFMNAQSQQAGQGQGSLQPRQGSIL